MDDVLAGQTTSFWKKMWQLLDQVAAECSIVVPGDLQLRRDASVEASKAGHDLAVAHRDREIEELYGAFADVRESQGELA